MSRSPIGGPALLGRYRRTFVDAWRDRHLSPASLLTPEEADFSSPALALTERPVSPTARVTAILLIGLVAIALAWACLGQVDIVANAVGEVIPSARAKTIASVQTAVVRAIYVKEGEPVTAGQVLVVLDAKPLEAERRKALAEETAAALEMARADALIGAIRSHRPSRLDEVPGVSPSSMEEAQRHLAAQYSAFAAKLSELDGEVESDATALPLARQREQIYGRLLKTHDVSQDAWLAKKQARIDLEGHLTDAENARGAFIAQARQAAYDTYTEAAQAVATERQEILRVTSEAAWLTLRSPVNGIVQQLAVHTIGGVVPSAQPILFVIPTGQHLEVQAYLENKDVGFVKVGERAQVKLTAFDYTRYGTISGRVISVSRDALENRAVYPDEAAPQRTSTGATESPPYLVRVALARSTINVDGQTRLLLPGMAVTVEIKTGKRRVIDYFLSPLLHQGGESLRER